MKENNEYVILEIFLYKISLWFISEVAQHTHIQVERVTYFNKNLKKN